MNANSIDEIAKQVRKNLFDLSGKTWNQHIHYLELYNNDDDYRVEYWKNASLILFWTVIQLENFYERNPHQKIRKYFPKENINNISQQRGIILQFDIINRKSFVT